MAKVSLTKLLTTKAIPDKVVIINDETISVVQYLPTARKANMIQDIMNEVLDNNGMDSYIRHQIYFMLYLVQYYTNFNITEKMMAEPDKTYDLLVLNHILEKIIAAIPETEYQAITDAVNTSIDIVSKFRTSIAGLFLDIQANNNESARSADEIMNQLNDVANNGLLQDVLTK